MTVGDHTDHRNGNKWRYEAVQTAKTSGRWSLSWSQDADITTDDSRLGKGLIKVQIDSY